ncbi:fungal-specific transcription factor domain family protein [Lipomyces starkeyi]
MANDLRDNVSRVKASSPLGTTIFVGLRVADVLWQYTIIHSGWGSKLIELLGGSSIDIDRVLDSSNGQLQPYYKLVIFMSLCCCLKQIVTLLFISEQEMPPISAVIIAAVNTIINSLNSIMSLWLFSSRAPTSERWFDILHSPSVAIGVGAYLVGLMTELISELQRKAFKRTLANKGKPYGGGLFSLATNINYGGYTVWRAGYALATGSLPWGILTFSFFFYDFSTRGVPVLDRYLTERYGEAWKEIKTRVKYRLFPRLY